MRDPLEMSGVATRSAGLAPVVSLVAAVGRSDIASSVGAAQTGPTRAVSRQIAKQALLVA